jgi:hypothetical protein
MYKLYDIVSTTGMYQMDIFYKILRNELWKITQPYLITGIWTQLRHLVSAVIIPIMVHTHLSSEAPAMGPITAAVPKDSVTPHTYS